MRNSVSTYDTVCAEVVAGCTLFEVTAVEPFFSSVIIYVYSLVYIVPDKAAAKVIVLLECVNILLLIAEAVFHSVSILTEDYRSVLIKLGVNRLTVRSEHIKHVFNYVNLNLLLLCKLFDIAFNRIHTADKVGFIEIEFTLVVYESCVIKLENCLAHMSKVLTVARLVTE